VARAQRVPGDPCEDGHHDVLHHNQPGGVVGRQPGSWVPQRYRACQLGLRFSAKARGPSTVSSERRMRSVSV